MECSSDSLRTSIKRLFSSPRQIHIADVGGVKFVEQSAAFSVLHQGQLSGRPRSIFSNMFGLLRGLP